MRACVRACVCACVCDRETVHMHGHISLHSQSLPVPSGFPALAQEYTLKYTYKYIYTLCIYRYILYIYTHTSIHTHTLEYIYMHREAQADMTYLHQGVFEMKLR